MLLPVYSVRLFLHLRDKGTVSWAGRWTIRQGPQSMAIQGLCSNCFLPGGSGYGRQQPPNVTRRRRGQRCPKKKCHA